MDPFSALFPPHPRLKEFRVLFPTLFPSSWRGLHGKLEIGALGGEVCVVGMQGIGWGWGDFLVIL